MKCAEQIFCWEQAQWIARERKNLGKNENLTKNIFVVHSLCICIASWNSRETQEWRGNGGIKKKNHNVYFQWRTKNKWDDFSISKTRQITSIKRRRTTFCIHPSVFNLDFRCVRPIIMISIVSTIHVSDSNT